MRETSLASLEFLLGHARWCLAQPLADGPRDWAARVGRAVDRVGEAFTRHVEAQEVAGGPLDQIAEPGHLPFSAAAQQVQRLRRQHATLGAEIRCVGELFRDSLLLFAPPPDSPSAGGGADEVAEMRAVRLFGVHGPRIGDLLDDLDAHLAAEKQLVAGAPLDDLQHESVWVAGPLR